MGKLNEPWAIIIAALIGLIGVLITGYFIIKAAQEPFKLSLQATQTAEARTIEIFEETLTPTPEPFSTNTLIPEPFPTNTPTAVLVPNESMAKLVDCPDLKPNETRKVFSQTYIIGDVEVDGVKQYDLRDYWLEGTVVFIEGSASIYAKQGAKCKQGDIGFLEQIIADEFEQGCGGGNCNTIRQVIVREGSGHQITTCYVGTTQTTGTYLRDVTEGFSECTY